MNGSILPNELLVLIGEQLDEHNDRWNLIFVCRRFYYVLLPLLYRSTKLRRWQDVNSFFHAIAKNTKLACAVRELDLGGWTSNIASSRQEREALKAPGTLKEHLRRYSSNKTRRQYFTTALCNGSADAWIALILPLMSQLRQLSLPWGNKAPRMRRIIQNAIYGKRQFQDKSHFQHLQRISFHFCSKMNEACVKFGYKSAFSELLMPFFQLPSLRGFSVNNLIDPSSPVDTENTDSIPIGFSVVTDIDLRESCGNHGMHKLISSCAALKTFKYQHLDFPLESIGYRSDRLYQSLDRHKGTLEILWLDNHGKHFQFTSAGLNDTRNQWFGSLADFTALRELRIRLHNLLDIQYQSEPTKPLFDCLPPSLESM
ncbi:hypothetical protein N7486_005993 [Penicillium sp. IBT 16267x]|nr:hypothetical protein N7486_005993 [Penicillium sp. IBT 16267x]